MGAADLDDISGRLYALPPEEFTAARDAEAKQAGETSLRAAVKALRRPTVPAWLVNRLAVEQPDLLDQLLDLGAALSAAQQEGRGDALRELGTQRRELVAAVAGTAVGLGDRPVTAAVRLEVEQTLEAALADPDSAAAVRSGRLVRALAYAGFGGVDLSGAVAVVPHRTSAKPKPTPNARPTPKAKATPHAQPTSAAPPTPSAKSTSKHQPDTSGDRARAAAEAAALEAAAALDDVVRACQDAERQRALAEQAAAEARTEADAASAEVTRLEQELAGARDRRAHAGKAADAAGRRRESAGRAAERAAAAVATAQEAADRARSALDRLRRS